jgi:hypothetical protein
MRLFDEKHKLTPHLSAIGKKAMAIIEKLFELLC